MGTAVRRSKERLPRQIWVLVAASFVIAIGYGIVAPVLPAFARSFNVGVTAASTVVSAFAVLRIVFAPVSGRLISRMGELWVFCGGLLVVGASSAACAFADDYWQLLVFRAAGGIGSTMFTVSAAALIVRISPPTMRGRATGAWSTGFLLGNIAGPVFGGVLAAISLRAPFLIYAGLLLVAVVITGCLLRGRTGLPQAPGGATDAAVPFGTLLRHRSFRAALASNFLHGWTVYGVRVALVPLFVVEVLRQPVGWSGAALSVFAAGTAATVLLGGLMADLWGRKLPILVGSALVSCTALGLGFSTTVFELLFASLLSGIGTGLLSTPVNASVGDLVSGKGQHRNAGVALAGFQMVGDLGAIIGPVLGGMIAELAGYRAAFVLTALIGALAFGSWLRAPETLERTRHGEAFR